MCAAPNVFGYGVDALMIVVLSEQMVRLTALSTVKASSGIMEDR